MRGGGLIVVFFVFIMMYEDIISLENLFAAWQEFLKGKRKRGDVREFSENLSGNIYNLHLNLKNKTYKHGGYHAFNISDPKPRNIHKASVRDRLLHHAVYRILYPYFDKHFLPNSYSCRLNKGVHKALNQFKKYYCRVGKNNTKQCFVLKCDIKKFFASIDHNLLRYIVVKHIPDKNINWLLNQIISSFHTKPGKGLPLGNLTSQLLVNIYMNEFDQYVKHRLKIKYYIRYADDFVIITSDRKYLILLPPRIQEFLSKELKLQLHPDKVFIKTVSSGVDFLGWVHFPDHRILRTVTKRRMIKNLSKSPSIKTRESYKGLMKHGNTYNLQKRLDL